MTPEDEKIYNNYFNLFVTDGWKQLVEMAEDLKDNYSIFNIHDERSLYQAKGELNIINQILNFESSTRFTYDELKAEENA